MLTYRLLDQFRQLFDGVKYLQRRSNQGDKIAVCLYEDLLALRESATLIQGIVDRSLVVNTRNRRIGVVARRGDGTFGPRVAVKPAITADGFSVARGEVSTVEIGIEVKIVSKAMQKQRDRVNGDLAKQVAAFQTKANNPVCVGVVGINWSDRYTNYDGGRTYPTNGRRDPHPVQQAEGTEAWLKASLARIIQEGSDHGRKTRASAWYKWLAHRHLPTTEALT